MANRRIGHHSGTSNGREVVADYTNIPQIVTLGLPQVVSDDSFPYEVTTNTEQTVAALAKVYNVTTETYTNLAVTQAATGYAANYQLFPDADVIGDIAYFGAVNKFGALYFDMNTNQTYANDSVTWEYWNGTSWVAFTPFDTTDQESEHDGNRSFGGDGYVFIHAPGWKDCLVDSQGGYWVRCRVTTAQVTTIGLTNSVLHYVVSSVGSRIHSRGKIVKGCFKFGATSTGTNDTKFIVANLSKGYFDNITITKAVSSAEVTMDVNVDDGDYLAFFCHQVDTGGTEFQYGTVELYVDKRKR